MLSICTNNLIMLLNYCYIDLLRHSFHRMKRERERERVRYVSTVCVFVVVSVMGIFYHCLFSLLCGCQCSSERFAVKYNP